VDRFSKRFLGLLGSALWSKLTIGLVDTGYLYAPHNSI
jgi:hypothetical protein